MSRRRRIPIKNAYEIVDAALSRYVTGDFTKEFLIREKRLPTEQEEIAEGAKFIERMIALAPEQVIQ